MMDDGWPVARDAAPPDHRRPRPRPRARHERVAALHAAPLVRLPRDADEGRAGDPAARHRVRELEQARHRRRRWVCREDRLHIVPVGVDQQIFRPMPEVARVPGRLMTTASADVPMKGLVPLLEALAKVRTERDDVQLVIIGKPKDKSKIPALIERLGLERRGASSCSGVTTERIVELYAEAEVAVVPSLYEGFSLPAIEAMACGVPLVATTGGALPEVVGPDGETGLAGAARTTRRAGASRSAALLGDAELRARHRRGRAAPGCSTASPGARTAERHGRELPRAARGARGARSRLMLTVDFDRLDLRAGRPAARHGLRRRSARVRGDAARRDRRRARLRRGRAEGGARRRAAR